MKSAKPVRGTRDILPEEMRIRRAVEDAVLSTYKQAGYREIETPALENLDLLGASEGGENLRMIFPVLKRGEKLKPTEDSTPADLADLGLRYDLTLPLTRFYSNNKEKLEEPFKSVQIGNVYRAERPQKGRYRSFKQCDIDILGDHSVAAEIDLIHTTAKALENLGFKGFKILINDRKILSGILKSVGIPEDKEEATAILLDKLSKIGETEVLNELVDKGIERKKAQGLLNRLKNLKLAELKKDYPEAAGNLERIIDAVTQTSGGNYQILFDPTLIRGMSYYTGPVFEIILGEAGQSVAGGGRYDNLVGKTSKEAVPAVGFSIGFERIVEQILEDEKAFQFDEPRVLLLCSPNKDDMVDVIKTADRLKAEGYQVNMVPRKKNLGKQIKKAEEKGYVGLYLYGRDDKVVPIEN